MFGPAESISALTIDFLQTDEAPGLYYRTKYSVPALRRKAG